MTVHEPLMRADVTSVDLAISGRPGPAELERRLLGLAGGRALLADPEPHLDELLGRGRGFAANRVRMRRLEPHRCHGNAARLWYESTGAIGIATGYACHGGLWVQHSWGVKGDRVIETTGRFAHYFGVELTTRESLLFTFSNAMDLMERLIHDLREGLASPAIMREIEMMSQEMSRTTRTEP
jgi:hypothetical protein